MNPQALQALKQRLDQLEREVRPLVEAAASPTTVVEEVQTNRLLLVDRENRSAALFSVVNGQPHLQLNDAKGQLRVVLTISEEGTPVLALQGSKGKGGIALGVAPDGSSRLETTDETGKVRTELTTSAEGSTRLAFLDQEGKTLIALLGPGKDVPTLVLSDETGRGRAALTVERDGSPALGLYDKEGKLQFRIQCNRQTAAV